MRKCTHVCQHNSMIPWLRLHSHRHRYESGNPSSSKHEFACILDNVVKYRCFIRKVFARKPKPGLMLLLVLVCM